MCVPPTTVKAAQAKAFAESGFTKDARLNLVKVPGLSFNPIGFLELPLFLVLAVVYRERFETRMLGPMFLFYLWKECVPMSVCLHRYFSHKGFKVGRVTQFVLYLGGCLASQVGQLIFLSGVFFFAIRLRRRRACCSSAGAERSIGARAAARLDFRNPARSSPSPIRARVGTSARPDTPRAPLARRAPSGRPNRHFAEENLPSMRHPRRAALLGIFSPSPHPTGARLALARPSRRASSRPPSPARTHP